MPANTDYADYLHVGQHQFEKAPRVPDASFGDAQIGISTPIAATKVKHQHQRITVRRFTAPRRRPNARRSTSPARPAT